MFPLWSTGSFFTLQALGSPMDLDVRSACRLLPQHPLDISGIVKPTYSWVYQTVQPSQYTIGFIRLLAIKPIHCNVSTIFTTSNNYTVKPTFSWVYQAVNNSPTLISTIHLYQQCTYINNQSSAKPTPLGLSGHQ